MLSCLISRRGNRHNENPLPLSSGCLPSVLVPPHPLHIFAEITEGTSGSPRELMKQKPGSTPSTDDSVGLRWGLEMCISVKFQEMPVLLVCSHSARTAVEHFCLKHNGVSQALGQSSRQAVAETAPGFWNVSHTSTDLVGQRMVPDLASRLRF